MRFTGSRTRLLALCQYGFRYDIEDRAWPDSAESRFGRALHWLAEVYLSGADVSPAGAAKHFHVDAGEEPRLAVVWGHMRTWIDRYGYRERGRAEVKLALNLRERKARTLGEAAPRDYSGAEEDETPTTLDLVDLGAAELWDWKTGHSVEGYWPQIATQALAVAWLTGAQRVRGGILHATETGVDDSRVRVFDAFDLAAIADDLTRDIEAIATSQPNPGEHCTEMRCGAFGNCPATIQAVEGLVALIPANELVRANHALSFTIESANHGAWALHRLRAVEAYAKQVREVIRAFVGDQEHPVDGGGVLRETFRTVNRLDIPKLIKLARDLGASDEAIAACSYPHRESAGIRVTKPRSAA